MWIRVAAVLLASLSLNACQQRAAQVQEPAERPNIVFILADDLGYGDLGVFGSEIPTPNLDRLARSGMLLTDFHTSMTCAPTRAMLMAGMDNHRAGMGVQGTPRRDDQLEQPGYEGHLNFRVAALPALLADAGYNTYMAGKWHLGSTAETGPAARGFRRVFASIDGAAHLGPWDWRGPQDARFFDGDEIVAVDDDWYSTRDYTRKMIDYIEQDRVDGRPFFAYMAYTAPHWPLQAPKEAIDTFKGRYDAGYEALYAERFARQQELGLVPAGAQPIDNARFSPRWNDLPEEEKRFAARRMEIYAAMVSELDHYVGELITYLDQIGELDNTFILFASDNGAEPDRRDLGPPFADHIGKEYDHSLDNLGSATSYVMYGANWASASASPWNRHKFTAFEGGIRVPGIAYWPGKIATGQIENTPAGLVDILPTICEITGTELPSNRKLDGISLLPLFEKKPLDRRQPLYWFYSPSRPIAVIRNGDWNLIADPEIDIPRDNLFNEEWIGMIKETSLENFRLYNLRDDPKQLKDLSQDHPEILKLMKEKMLKLHQEIVAEAMDWRYFEW